MAARSSFGERLSSLRATHGGSVQEVADAVGVSRSYLSGLENDLDKPGYDTFVALANFYGVSLDWLATGDGDRTKGNLMPRENQLIEHFRALSEGEQNFLLLGLGLRPPDEAEPDPVKKGRR